MNIIHRTSYLIILFAFVVSLTGCTTLVEWTKMGLGISIKALQEARSDAARRMYRCSYDQCYDAVLESERDPEALAEHMEERRVEVRKLREEGKSKEADAIVLTDGYNQGIFDVFMKSRKKSYIIVMGISGYVDTTEVGIFFEEDDDTVTIDISSLSSRARDHVARELFKELGKKFTEVK